MSGSGTHSHLAISFPIKSPADAKALTEELPPLMPDFAKAQDTLGNVHFSRFMVAGDEKLLFLADVDGEAEKHIERLVGSAGPVFDAIFKHVENPPLTPVASNSEAVIKWVKHHNTRALAPYAAFEGASVQDIKASARAASFTGSCAQGSFLVFEPVKSALKAFTLEQVVLRATQHLVKKGADSVGTLHFAYFVPFENNHVGFFTVYDGSFEKYVQDFLDKIGPVFDVLFEYFSITPPTPVAKYPKEFYKWSVDHNRPAIGFYSAYPGLGVQDIGALLADAKGVSA
jgi:hypothetical protein